jgi:phosphohistidine swiveling domain-containing protein
MIRFFKELSTEDEALSGSKGCALARLYRAGYPVPDGFIVLPGAFAGDDLTPAAWGQVCAAIDRLKGPGDASLVVRSSASSEDASGASFAGQYETVLQVRTPEEIREAIWRVRRSQRAERVQAYGQAVGLESSCRVAVIIQRMVQADMGGVVFTVDPVTGSRDCMVGNMVYGGAGQVVAGEVDALPFTLGRPGGEYEGPAELSAFAPELYHMAERLEVELGAPQDIEWAISEERLYLLQSRPITTLCGYDPMTGECNDSLTGDFLWVSGNFGEAVPGVMSPYTWSLIKIYFEEERNLHALGRLYPTIGNICGRLYMNASVWLSASAAVGIDPRKVMEASASMYGDVPRDVSIPVIPVSTWWIVGCIPGVLQARRRLKELVEELPEFAGRAPVLVHEIEGRIRAVDDPTELAALWRETLTPLLHRAALVLLACNCELQNAIGKLQRDIQGLADVEDADALLSGWSTVSDYIESLGPLVGLIKILRGEMDRETYIKDYGHRGVDEFEFSRPGQCEDPDWMDRQLAEIAARADEIEATLARRQRIREDAWQQFEAEHPQQAEMIRPHLDRVSQAIHLREKTRSEVTRVMRLARAFALRAGAITGLGDDVFFLSIEEVLSVLGGVDAPVRFIPARRETDARYRQLPPLPAVIRGRFDAFEWAANPDRRRDLFDASAPPPAVGTEAVRGLPATAGTAEGRVRVLESLDEAEQFRPGEVLVTSKMNIGWTILFPKCAAVVTDVGAPLSHAAIVARELGIPTVVSCGNATSLLRTGTRVRVDGTRGTVSIVTGES